MDKIYFGVDIGGTTVKVGCFDENGNLHSKYEIVTRRDGDGSYILSDIFSSIEEHIYSIDENVESVKGIGIGVPGPVLDERIVNGCVNLGWGTIDVEKEAKKYTNAKVKIGNDANMAALGEMFKGGAQGYNNVVMVTLGTGVGGGIILGGKLINGANGAGGEIGHIPVVHNATEQCGCGKYGCLEQVASATGIVKYAKKLIENTDMQSTLRSEINITAKDVFEAAKIGDEMSVDVIEQVGFYLGTALANIACVIDPEIFVIGGGVSDAGEILLDVIRKTYKEKAFKASRETKIVKATLGNDAGIYGAVKMVLEE